MRRRIPREAEPVGGTEADFGESPGRLGACDDDCHDRRRRFCGSRPWSDSELRRALAPVGIIIWSTLRAVSPVFEGNKDWQIWRKP